MKAIEIKATNDFSEVMDAFVTIVDALTEDERAELGIYLTDVKARAKLMDYKMKQLLEAGLYTDSDRAYHEAWGEVIGIFEKSKMYKELLK